MSNIYDKYVIALTKAGGFAFGKCVTQEATESGWDRTLILEDACDITEDIESILPLKKHGVSQLASLGPREDCNVAPRLPSILLTDVVAVLQCNERAVRAFETHRDDYG